jgi:hypothetical protein
MADFKSRQEGFEAKAARDEELNFKVGARRNKLLGQWAAGLLGLSGAEAEDYAKSVVASDFEEAGDEDVFRKVSADLKAKNVEVSEHRLRKQMVELMEEARKQVMGT